VTRSRSAVLVALLLVLGSTASAGAQQPLADVCLEIEPGAVSEAEWAALAKPVAASVASRPALFPQPAIAEEGTTMAILAGRDDHVPKLVGPCLEDGFEWTARFERTFLEAGADQMLAEAPTTPGISSEVDIEWYPDESRLRTTLTFAGPLDIPNGTCWVDDTLALESATGLVSASGEQDRKTSPFAEGACDRFFDHLPDGGAGEQAVTLLPSMVELADGSRLRFVASEVSVGDDAIVVAGSLSRD
jgi:hypothetical protein